MRQCLARLDASDFGMGMRRAQKGGMRGIAADRQIIDVAATAGQQAGIFDAFNRCADKALWRWLVLHGFPPGASDKRRTRWGELTKA